jgi:chemotaxis receptor (MCP) glutamine deamidase CheD
VPAIDEYINPMILDLNTASNRADLQFLIDFLGETPIKEVSTRKSVQDNSAGILVFQQEYGVACGKDEEPILETIGAGPCIIVALYDSASQVGGLMHLSSMTVHGPRFEWLRSMIGSMYRAGYQDNKRDSVQVHIIGGYEGMSDSLYSHIKEGLSMFGFNKIIETDYGDLDAESVSFDTRTGEIYDLENILPSSFDVKEQQIMRIRELRATMTEVNYTLDQKAKKTYR